MVRIAPCGRARPRYGLTPDGVIGGSFCPPEQVARILYGVWTMTMKIDIGIDAHKRQELASGLSRVLADSYTLYLETHNFHWNVTGPMFRTLHLMFETQYGELALAVDVIAERIRTLGVYAPGTYRQ